MGRRSLFLASLSLSFFLLSAHCVSQQDQSRLKPGDILPPLAGQALTGKWVDVTSIPGDNPVAVLFSFSRDGGRDAQLWAQRLMKDDPYLKIYTIIFLESVPRLFRAMAVSGIKNGMPSVLHDQTILLYRDEDIWKQRLRVSDEHRACLMLLGPVGRVHWMTLGPFSDALYSEFRKSIRTLH